MVEETKVGRKSTYNDGLAAMICEQVASGKTLKSICALPNMPSETTVHRWRTEEDKTGFRDSYKAAKLIQFDVLFDSMLDIARGDRTNDAQIKVQRDTLEINTIKHYVSTLNPIKYGANPVIEDTSKDAIDMSKWSPEQFAVFKELMEIASTKKNDGI